MTIVSPDAIAKATNCTGYTAISDFSGAAHRNHPEKEFINLITNCSVDELNQCLENYFDPLMYIYAMNNIEQIIYIREYYTRY